MDKNIPEKKEELRREERLELLNDRSPLDLEGLDAVNGSPKAIHPNPDSEIPDGNGNWESSFGYICAGEEQC